MKFQTFILLLFLTNINSPSVVAEEKLSFTHYTTKNGLPQNAVLNISQDDAGAIWLATGKGLCSYDGFNFKLKWLTNQTEKRNEDQMVLKILKDSQGNFWLQQLSDLLLYNTKTSQFSLCDFEGAPNLNIKNVLVQNDDQILVNSSNGLYFYNYSLQGTREKILKFKKLLLVSNFPDRLLFSDHNNTVFVSRLDSLFILKNNNLHFRMTIGSKYKEIENMIQDKDGRYWMNSARDIFIYDIKQNKSFNITSKVLKFMSQNVTISTLFCDRNGNVWIGTGGDGFFIFSTNNIVTHYKHNNKDTNSLGADGINDFFEDKKGNVWISFSNGGCDLAIRQNPDNGFRTLSTQIFESIFSVLLDKNNNVWIGMGNGVLSQWNPTNGRIIQYYPTNNTKSKSGGIISSIVEDNENNIWAGSWGFVLHKLSATQRRFDSKAKFENFSAQKGCENRLNGWSIRDLLIDRKGDVWIAYFDSGLEVIKPTERSNKIVSKHYLFDATNNKSILSNSIWTIVEDKDGLIWIGTYDKGVGIFNPVTETCMSLSDFMKKPIDMAKRIQSIYQDKKGDMWFGSGGNGLFHYNRKQNELYNYTETDGLCNNTIYGITEDANHNLWLTTDKGLSNFQTSKNEFLNFYERDGLISDVFLPGSNIDHDSKGWIYAGSDRGLIYFNPVKFNVQNPEIKTYISEFSINNALISDNHSNKLSLLKQNILFTKEIELDYTQNNLSFEFNTFNYDKQKFIVYSYKLTGFDDQWVYLPENMRTANYTNIPPGNYTLEVRASNGNGKWSEQITKLYLFIRPPFWQTWWFRLSSLVFVVLSVLFFIKQRLMKIEAQKQKLEEMVKIQVKEIEAQKDVLLAQSNQLLEVNSSLEKQQADLVIQATELKLLNQTKDKLFSIIGHDLRNPFQAIIGNSELYFMQHTLPNAGEINKTFLAINKSAHTASNLLENLLHWGRMQSAGISVSFEHFDVCESIDDSIDVFKIVADSKEISLESNQRKPLYVYADRMMITTVIRNLLNNAIKFTELKGKVWVECKVINDRVHVSVCDTGVGMDEEFVTSLLHFNSNHSMVGTNGESGVGLGLVVSNGFIALHNSRIQVQSQVNKGSKFMIDLALGNEIQNPSQDIKSKVLPITASLADNEEVNTVVKFKTKTCKKELVLVVDDDDSVRNFMVKIMESKYTVISAENGLLGYEKALQEIPDLIVSDVMMPEMNGFEFCEKIKQNELVNHIPIILLTANKTEQSHISGLQIGADDYITKPFGSSIIMARADNLIQNRKVLREKFLKEFKSQNIKLEFSIKEDPFMAKATEIILANISNSDLSVEFLASKLCLGRSQLLRKMKQLSGESPVEYIRLVRLKKAMELLTHPELTISEVAYKTGFSDLSYFSRSFTHLFGCSPSDYVRNNTAAPQ